MKENRESIPTEMKRKVKFEYNGLLRTKSIRWSGKFTRHFHWFSHPDKKVNIRYVWCLLYLSTRIHRSLLPGMMPSKPRIDRNARNRNFHPSYMLDENCNKNWKKVVSSDSSKASEIGWVTNDLMTGHNISVILFLRSLYEWLDEPRERSRSSGSSDRVNDLCRFFLGVIAAPRSCLVVKRCRATICLLIESRLWAKRSMYQ